MHEVGVCPLEAVTEAIDSGGVDTHGLPLIGASPDCFLVYPDGAIEALEVCMCVYVCVCSVCRGVYVRH